MEKTKMHEDIVDEDSMDEDILDDDSFVTEEEGDGPCDQSGSCEDVDDL